MCRQPQVFQGFVVEIIGPEPTRAQVVYWLQAGSAPEFRVVARLKPGIRRAQAVAELTSISRRVHDEHRNKAFVADRAFARPLLEAVVGEVEAPLYILLGATGPRGFRGGTICGSHLAFSIAVGPGYSGFGYSHDGSGGPQEQLERRL